MTVFTDDDFKEVTTHDGFVSRDKDFVASLEEVTIQPLGKKDSLAVSLRFSDDPEGEKLLNIFGIDQAKDGSYNKKMGMGAFIESLAKCSIQTRVARKMKDGTNKDDSAYEYAIKFIPILIGKTMSMHMETSKYTKDGAEKESQTWTVVSVGAEPSQAESSPTANNDKLIEAWREIMCNQDKIKLLGLPGTKKNIILNLKKVVTDPKKVEAMQTVRDATMKVLSDEGILTIDAKGVITPI